MGLLLVGVLAGILIGFAWLSPGGYPEACTFQWQGCFDQVGPPARPQSAPPKPDQPIAHAQSMAAPVKHGSARALSAKPHRRVALAREAVQSTKINVPQSERRTVQDPVLDKAKASIAAKMDNPASVEFRDMDRAFRKNTFGRATDTICGHVRGKTAAGGDTGERPFLYLVKEDDAYVVDGKPNSAAAIAYRNICN